MQIQLECYHLLLLFLSTTVISIIAAGTCPNITKTDLGNVLYIEANYAVKHSPGTVAFIACKFGYVNSFPYLVFCQPNGTWNDELGNCTLGSKTCDRQNTESNVIYMPPEVTEKYPSGTIAMLNCPADEKAVGMSSTMCVDGKWTVELGCCKKLSSSAFCEPAAPRLSSTVLRGSESVSPGTESVPLPGIESVPLRTESETTTGIVIVSTTTINQSITSTEAEVTTSLGGISKASSVTSSEKAAVQLPKLLKAGTRRGATTTAPSILAID